MPRWPLRSASLIANSAARPPRWKSSGSCASLLVGRARAPTKHKRRRIHQNPSARMRCHWKGAANDCPLRLAYPKMSLNLCWSGRVLPDSGTDRLDTHCLGSQSPTVPRPCTPPPPTTSWVFLGKKCCGQEETWQPWLSNAVSVISSHAFPHCFFLVNLLASKKMRTEPMWSQYFGAHQLRSNHQLAVAPLRSQHSS